MLSPAGRPNRHRTSNVQSTCGPGPPRVLHQSATGRSGVFIALHKHGGGTTTTQQPESLPARRLVSLSLTLTCLSARRGTAALGRTRPKPSDSWWRSGLCVSSHRKPSTRSGWITSSSCPCQWTRPPTQVRARWETPSSSVCCSAQAQQWDLCSS